MLIVYLAAFIAVVAAVVAQATASDPKKIQPWALAALAGWLYTLAAFLVVAAVGVWPT